MTFDSCVTGKDTVMLVAIFIALSITGFVSGNDTTPGTETCPRRCKPTCAVPNPPNCTPNKNCSCKNGHIYPNRRNNTCIPIYQCPQDAGCNGDENAIIQQRSLPCRPTCKNPSQANCFSRVPILGCICKADYILSETNGTCIPLEDCPGNLTEYHVLASSSADGRLDLLVGGPSGIGHQGSVADPDCNIDCHPPIHYNDGGHPCGQNRTFTTCTACRFNSCPRSEITIRYACDPIWPCPAGCVCDSEYKSFGGKCILPEDCPPFPCTRPNEEWERCPSPCFSDSCTDIPKWYDVCEVYGPCYPKCSCKDGFARAVNRTCIPIEDCPNFSSLDI